jgi:hypothetical protein
MTSLGTGQRATFAQYLSDAHLDGLHGSLKVKPIPQLSNQVATAFLSIFIHLLCALSSP